MTEAEAIKIHFAKLLAINQKPSAYPGDVEEQLAEMLMLFCCHARVFNLFDESNIKPITEWLKERYGLNDRPWY